MDFNHDNIISCHDTYAWMMGQVGVLAPEAVPTGKLCTGQVGYVITGMKTTKSAQIGDTWHLAKQPVEALPGFKPAKSMVFSGITWTGLKSRFAPNHSVHGPRESAVKPVEMVFSGIT